MRALLFAAGLGTRLKPLTETMPKAMVPVGGVPLIEINLRRLIKAGAEEVVVNVHHFGGQIIRFLQSKDWGIPVRVSDERAMLLDTGGGIRQAASLFALHPDDPILMHNVDILSTADLSAFYAQSFSHDVTLMVSVRQTQRYLLFNDENLLCGWTNEATGAVRSPYAGLDPARCRKYAFSGIHCITPRAVSLMESYPEKFPVMDFYLDQCAKLRIKGMPQPGLRLLDVGKIAALPEAEEFAARHGL